MTAKNETNHISVEGNGNIIIQGVKGSQISIDSSNSDDILAKLAQLEDSHLDALSQIKDDLGQLFQTLLTGFVSQKNIVKGSISNIKGDVVIGDNNTRNYYFINREESKKSKELSLHLPRLRANQIVGREKDLEDLHKRLFDNKQVVLVNGMGGIGKTTLAQVYLTKYYDEYKYILWLGLNTEEADFEADFIRTEGLLARLGINPEGKTIQQSFTELIAALKELDGSPCLLVIDNATATLAKHYTILPNQPNWHILATSRERIEHFDLKALDFLEEEEAIQLFRLYYTRDRLDDAFLINLVKELEYHTLTIEILAKTAQEQRTSPEALLNAIQNDLEVDLEGIRHSENKVLKLTSYLCSIFKTSHLTENETWLLQQFICLPTEAHTYELLEELIPIEENTSFNLAKTLNRLSKKGWLLYNEEADAYKIHRIIIDVVKRSIGLEEKDVDLLLDTIITKLLIDQTKDNPIDKFQWVPFGKAFLLQFENSSSKKTSPLQNNLAIVFRALGNYEEAKILLKKAIITAEENFEKEHPYTSVLYSNLALVLQDLGDYEKAKVLLEKTTIFAEEKYGKDHSNVALLYSNLAMTLHVLGDYEEAKVLLKKAMIIAEKNFGKDHPSTTGLYSNLALVLQDLGNYEEAKVLLEKAIVSDEKNLGENHPNTAIHYSNLAIVLQDLGDYEEAKVLLDKAIVSDEKNFGKDHPNTAVRYSNLAIVLQELGDYEEAKVLLDKAIVSDEKKFGKDHSTLATNRSNLAIVLQELGDYEGAKVLLEKAIISDKKNFGEDHPNTAIRYSNLALVLQDLGDYEEAKVLSEKAYKTLKKQLGDHHPHTIKGKKNLAYIISLMNK